MKLALYSSDLYFIKAFSNYICQKQCAFELVCFTSQEQIIFALQKESWEGLLSESSDLRKFADNMIYIELGNRTVYPKEGTTAVLNIYQQSSALLEELEYLLHLSGVQILSLQDKENGKMVGFFSTEGGSGKTSLAYLTAVSAAKSCRTAYFNLEALAAISNLYTMEFPVTMERILFALKDGRSLDETFSGVMMKNSDGVYVLPTVKSIGDYLEITPETIYEILNHLLTKGAIELLVVDLPCAFSSMTIEILNKCNKIVWVYSDTTFGMSKYKELTSDPYLVKGQMKQKSLYIRNKCTSKQREPEIVATFPFSQRVQQIEQISKILSVSEEFKGNCQVLVQELLKE